MSIDITVAPVQELRKMVKISFMADAVEAELARREQLALTVLDDIKASGVVLSDGTALTYIELLEFLQHTVAIKETSPVSVWATVSEARSLLGTAYPKSRPWKTLEEYKTK